MRALLMAAVFRAYKGDMFGRNGAGAVGRQARTLRVISRPAFIAARIAGDIIARLPVLNINH